MNQFRVRLLFLSCLLVLCAAVVVARLFTIQVLEGTKFAARSRMQSQQRCFLPAQRGSIMDRNGKMMAANTQNELSIAMDVLGARTSKQGEGTSIKRVYPAGETIGPLIGYVGKDGYGLGGIEFAFDKYLRGEDGWTILQRDGRNHRYRKIGMPFKAPRTGSNVWLTIDAEIQKIVYNVLKQTVVSLQARGGSGVVMDPFSGKIFAMVNDPSFDPNLPSRYSLDQRKNACISTIYEPGSTFKIVTAAAALQDDIKKEHDMVNGNNGIFVINHETIRDHAPYGKLTFIQALSYSSNVCFAKIASELGKERLYRYSTDFGFGARTGITLPGEESGIVHPVRTWSGRTLVTMAIGQEISVTLLQIMCAYAAVANGGILVTPQVCEKIVESDGTIMEQAAVAPVRRVLSEETARRLRLMLKTVVDSGTGKNASIPAMAIAGKTGTSQKIDSGVYSKTRSWASFIGFLPSDRPVLLCGIVIDEPSNNLMGATAAAPAFKKIVTQLISHPALEFAEKILKHERPIVKEFDGSKPPSTRLSSLMTTERPSPADTIRLSKSAVTITDAAASSRTVPNCIGKDARDAVNMLNLRGLVPHVIGAGMVRRQLPPAGSLTTAAQACTLVCSFGG